MATRLRLPSATTAAVSPAPQSYSHTLSPLTRRTLPTADASALETQAYRPDFADHLVAGDALRFQFVSEQMAADMVFTSGDTLKFAIQGLEESAGNNLAIQCFVGVVNAAGDTAQATIRSKVSEGTELGTALANRFLSTTLSGSYTTVAGDRLVVEISATGTPTNAISIQGHNASFRWGSDGASGDLPENDTETGTTFNPWIEFATTITFMPRPSQLTTLGAG